MDRGAGDLALGYAATMAKTHPSNARFLTKDSRVHDFSLLGGSFNHIHFLAHDKNQSLYNLLRELLFRTEEEKQLANKDCAFYIDDMPVGIVRLLPNGRIGIYKHPNETFWIIREGSLIFLHENGEVTSEFQDFIANKKNCIGIHLADFATKPSIRIIGE